MRKQKSQSRFLFFCTAPAMLLIILFMIYPTLSVFRMSLYKWGGYSPNKQFVGLNNFQILVVILFWPLKFATLQCLWQYL